MLCKYELYEQNGETQTWAGNGNDEEQHFSRKVNVAI
jgi:hypothetical protein